MTCEVEKFVASPTQEELISLKKDELLMIVKYYKLEDIKRSMRKAAIYNTMLRYFVEQEIFEDSILKFLEETEVGSKASEQLEMTRLEMEMEERQREERQEKMKYELELKKLEMEERQKSREFEERQKDKELELRNKELEHKVSLAASHSTFDVSKHNKLVPPFQEKEVDIYFLHFEKTAENLKWPKENWTLLLHSVLNGKARDVYTQLSVGQSSSYETVKEMILKSYELVPEAYRQQFRNCRKNFDQTYVEF